MVLLRPAPIPNHSLPPPILPSVPPVLGVLSALSRTGILLPLPIGSLFRKTFSSYFFSLFLPLFSLSGLFRDPWGFSSLPRFIPRFPFLFSSLLLSFGSFRASLGLFGAFWGLLGLFRNSPLLYFSFPLLSFPFAPLSFLSIPYPFLITFRPLSSWAGFGIFRSPLERSPLVTIPTASSTILTPFSLFRPLWVTIPKNSFSPITIPFPSPSFPYLPLPLLTGYPLGFRGFSGFLCAFPPLYTPFPGRFFTGRGMFRPLFGILWPFFSFLSFISLLYIYLGLFGYFLVFPLE